jgi:hypothetical protein
MVQETFLNSHTVMLPGRQILPWMSVAAMAVLFAIHLLPSEVFRRLWGESGYNHSPRQLVNSLALTMEKKLNPLEPPQLESLLTNIEWYETLVCQDPRDRIYALLSISEDSDQLNIIPSYHEPIGSVYIHTTIKLLRSMKTLQILEYTSTLDNLSDDELPSWSLNPRSSDESSAEWLGQVPSKLGDEMIRFEDDNTVLVFLGQIVDRISVVTPPIRYPISGLFNESTVESFQCDCGFLSNLLNILEHAGPRAQSAGRPARVIFPNQSWDDDTAAFNLWFHLRATLQEVDIFAGKNSMDRPPIADATDDMISTLTPMVGGQLGDFYSEDVRQANALLGLQRTHGRSLCVTESGKMCNATGKTAVGDVIALMHGASVPFVLRPTGDCFKCEGTAYIQEFMGVAPGDDSVEIRLI